MLEESLPQSATEDERSMIGAPAVGWDRTAVTLRLTEERKRALRALLPAGDPSEGPTAAIDRALSMAIDAIRIDAPADGEPRDGRAATAQVADLAGEVQRLGDQTREALGMLESIQASMAALFSDLASVAAAVADLRGAISAAAALGGGHVDGFEEPPAPMAEAIPSLPDWLDSVAGPKRAWAVVEARVIARFDGLHGMKRLELEARLVGVEGADKPPLSGGRKVELRLEAKSLSARELEPGRPMILACRKHAAGWSATARRRDEFGKLGPELAAFEIH